METEIGVTQPQAQLLPAATGSWKRQSNRFSPRASRGSAALPTPLFQPRETHFILPGSITDFCCFKSPSCGHLLQQLCKTNTHNFSPIGTTDIPYASVA